MGRHKPFERVAPGSDTLVLFVHGFLGSPLQFTHLSERVFAAGISSAAVLLPGHGGTSVDFARYGLAQWMHSVNKAVGRYSKQYTNIILAGHSIGGLLCLNAGLSYSGAVKGIVLLSVPLKITHLSSLIKNVLRFCLPRTEYERYIAAANRGFCSVGPFPLYACPFWISRVADVFLLIERTGRILKDIYAPVTVINSRADEVAAFESMGMFKKGLTNAEVKTLALEYSPHACYVGKERERVDECLLTAIGKAQRTAAAGCHKKEACNG